MVSLIHRTVNTDPDRRATDSRRYTDGFRSEHEYFQNKTIVSSFEK